MLIDVVFFVAPGGAGLSDEQREEMTNSEGAAAGGATPNYFFFLTVFPVDFCLYFNPKYNATTQHVMPIAVIASSS